MINNSGRRKAAIARIYMKDGNGKIEVNNRSFDSYFPLEWHRSSIESPLRITDNYGKFDISVNVRGGGQSGQAEAVRLGIAKALVDLNAELKPTLRAAGFMTRDSRVVERKKSGQKKARKRFQFSKR
ncbi:MAG: 30S ribosomal protein S9 [Bacteroidetes bacterium]|nr:30S ribosomal protein S9 [Bacteroidota bacterium]